MELDNLVVEGNYDTPLEMSVLVFDDASLEKDFASYELTFDVVAVGLVTLVNDKTKM